MVTNRIAHKGQFCCCWCTKPVYGKALWHAIDGKQDKIIHIECAHSLGVQAGFALGAVAQIVEFSREPTWDSSKESE